MSKEAGKARTAKRQVPKSRPGRRPLEHDIQEPLTLGDRAEALSLSKDTHSHLLVDNEAQEIQARVEEMSLEANRLREIQKDHTVRTKTKSRELNPIEEDDPEEDNTSSEQEEMEETNSKLSHDTQPYSEQSKVSPTGPFRFGTSPRLDGQAPPFVVNPQPLATAMTPAPVPSNVSAAPVDTLALIQTMFSQQAEANRQQAESNRQLQMLLASSLDKQIDQQSKQLQQQANIVARQAIADVRISIKPMRDGVNVCQYFEHLETELRDAKIPVNKWKGILVAKLSPKAEKTSAHLIHNQDATYTTLKQHLLKHIGPSADELCNIVHGAAYGEFKDKKEMEKLQHAKFIAERYFLGTGQTDDANIHHMAIRLYKFHCNKRFAHAIKLSKAQTMAEVLELTSSFDSQLDYERTKSDRPYTTYSKPFTKKTFCDFCKKLGHSEADCFKKQNNIKQEFNRQYKQSYKPNHQETNTSNTPRYNKQSYKDAGIKTRPATVNWSQTNATVSSIKGIVNGHEADVIIDTSAQITVVPGKFVYTDDLTGETVSILGVNGDPMPYQTAKIPITLRDNTVYETVAVASADQLNAKVLLLTPINSIITEHLLDSYLDKQKHEHKEEQKQEVVHQAIRSNLRTKPPISYYPKQEDSACEDERASDLSYEPDSDTDTSVLDSTDAETTTDEEPLVPTHAPSVKHSNSLPLPPKPNQTPNQTITSFKPIAEPYSPETLTANTEPYSSENLTHSDLHCPDEQITPKDSEPFHIPNLPIIDKADNIEALKSNTKADPTLKIIRGLAHHNKNGYTRDNGLLYHISLDPTLGEKKRLVVPKPQRQALVEIAHDRLGHFSVAKTRAILNNKFTWPKMASDVHNHILVCIKCKEFNKVAHKQAPFHTRPTITEPYQEIALDIIGPLPRSKHGFRFALTAICMASRWPEVYPLRNAEAESVANALIEFLSRNGIPSKILMDQGSQFMSNIMTQTCQMLGITHITTVPYRPQGNGVLERFHGTLKPLLAKTTADGTDWVTFLPLALSAIRSIPCHSTGFSPAELVFGKTPRNFLDIIFEGWSNPSYSSVDVVSWVHQLNDKLELLRDTATLTNQIARYKQNDHKAKSRSLRTYKPGDLVFTRIPGCRAVLQASWEGPFKIIKSIPPLNYEVGDLDNTWARITHINNLRSYQPLPKPSPNLVNVACLVAEEPPELAKALEKTPLLHNDTCIDFSQTQLNKLLEEYQDIFSTTPGEANVAPFTIKLQEDATASSRPPYQVPIHLRGEVNSELDKLLNNNIIEQSEATDWCAPLCLCASQTSPFVSVWTTEKSIG